MLKSILPAALAVCLACLPEPVSAKTFTGDHYAITFGSAWDTVGSDGILGKNLGLSGLATLGADPGSSLPDVDSLTAAYSESLSADIKKDSSGRKNLGSYDVHWQKYTYDSLPALDEAIAQMGFPIATGKGEFRVYYLNAAGINFAIACLSATGGKPPYADVETALATLTLSGGTGISPRFRTFARDVWVDEGRLGGDWLRENRVSEVECYGLGGAFLGRASRTAEGGWRLPEIRGGMLLRLRTAGGSVHFLRGL